MGALVPARRQITNPQETNLLSYSEVLLLTTSSASPHHSDSSQKIRESTEAVSALPSPGSCASAAEGLSLLVTTRVSTLFLGFLGFLLLQREKMDTHPCPWVQGRGRSGLQFSIFS